MSAASTDPLIDVELTAISTAADDTKLYELRRTDGQPMPPVEPGAHIDIYLPSGLIRQYSLTSAEGITDRYVIGVKKDAASRGGSREMHDTLKVGMRLKIGGPRNNFELDAAAPHTVLFAGGIGVTPIWAMVQRLAATNKSWKLYFSSRNRSQAAFLDGLSAHGSKVTLHFDDEAQGKFLDMAAAVASAPEGTHFYCCGPTPMLEAFQEATAKVPVENVHLEYFTSTQEAATEGGYTVVLKESGKEFYVPEGKTILDVLLDAKIPISHSCTMGICGSCETVVLEGIPDHRDDFLTPKEKEANKTIMICCSGSLSPKLVLDL